MSLSALVVMHALSLSLSEEVDGGVVFESLDLRGKT